MNSLDFIKEASKRYNLEIHNVVKCLKLAIKQSGNYGEISDEIKNDKIHFYETFYNRFGERKFRAIKITRNIYQGILDRFIDNLIEISMNQQIRQIGRQNSTHQAISGKIVEINHIGLKVLTHLGYAVAPKINLLKKELATKHYEIDKVMFFHIKKVRKEDLKVQIILDRTHQSIPLAEAQSIMSDCGVFAAHRDFGKDCKVYCSKQPTKEQIKTLAKQLNEKIVVELRR